MNNFKKEKEKLEEERLRRNNKVSNEHIKKRKGKKEDSNKGTLYSADSNQHDPFITEPLPPHIIYAVINFYYYKSMGKKAQKPELYFTSGRLGPPKPLTRSASDDKFDCTSSLAKKLSYYIFIVYKYNQIKSTHSL